MSPAGGEPETGRQVGPVLVHLLRAVLYRDRQEALWQSLGDFQAVVRDYLAVIGLELVVDDAEGYAFARQREGEEGDESLPRLVQRRPLSYPVSLLCVQLRKRVVEQDAGGGDTRVIVSREQIVEMMRVFLPQRENEAKTLDQIGRHIGRVVDYGFLRPLKGQEGLFEVRRVIKALVNADLLVDIDRRLEAYRRHIEQASE